MNVYTPYVFELTEGQAGDLRRQVGFSPARFEVYETYLGYNDSGPHWNLVLRFSENEAEIPLKLLLPERASREAHDEMGWKNSNPCFPNLHSRK
jgi:hypothetical protein